MKNLFIIALGAVALTGCKPILSSVLQGPDETAVVDAAPLTLPPSFELRPPRPGQKDTTAEAKVAHQKTEALIMGEEVSEEEAAAQGLQTSGTAKVAIEEDDAWLFDKINNSGEAEELEVDEVVEPSKPKEGFFQRTFSKKSAQ